MFVNTLKKIQLKNKILRNFLKKLFADSLSVDYPAQVTTRRLSMTVAVAVAVEEASK